MGHLLSVKEASYGGWAVVIGLFGGDAGYRSPGPEVSKQSRVRASADLGALGGPRAHHGASSPAACILSFSAATKAVWLVWV